MPDPTPAAPVNPGSRQALFLGLCAIGLLVPVTLPVPVLRGLVQERFGVSVFWTSMFMSINMIGATFAAPLAGAFADRLGQRKTLILGALLLDAVCFTALTLDLPFAVFLGVRLLEGCAHITALSLLLSLASDLARQLGRGHTLGLVGAGITLGVAIGAPIGGALGRVDPLRPLQVAAGLDVVLAVACLLLLRNQPRRSGPRPGLRAILRLARDETSLLLPLTYAFVDRFTVGFFTTTFTLWMKQVYGLEPPRIGLLLGLFLGAFSLLSYPFARLAERRSRVVLLAGGSLVYGAGVMSLGLCSPDALVPVMLALGIASAVMFVPSLILTTELAPAAIRSTALGAFNAAGSLGFVVGPLVGGAVSQLVAGGYGWPVGYATAFVVAGASQIVCVATTLPALRRLVRAGRTR